jgi:protein-disulfide isomerase
MFQKRVPAKFFRPLLVVTASAILFAITLPRQASAESVDQGAIAQEVRKEMQRLIQQEGVLDAAIERGITNYIRKQQALAQVQKARKKSDHARNLRPVSTERDHIKGNPDANITLVEYSDFECPFCKRFHPTVEKLIEENDGKVNWVYRHFPLQFHNPGAQKQAEASECAAEIGGNDAFWKYSDLVYARTRSNGNGFPITGLVPLAGEIGLDPATFKECLDSGRMAAQVKEDYQDGVKAGITGTPGVILLNHTTGDVLPMAGAVPMQQLQAAVDRLAAAGKTTGGGQ